MRRFSACTGVPEQQLGKRKPSREMEMPAVTYVHSGPSQQLT